MFEIEISNKKMRVNNKTYPVLSKDLKFTSYGIYGKIGIKKSEFIVFITEILLVGKIFNSDVFEISKVEIVNLSGPAEPRYIKGIKNILEKSGIYFNDGSYPLYRNISIGYSDSESDFVFNHVPINRLSKYDRLLGSLTVKCIQGYFNFINVENMKITLISRRCWKRCGSRYFSRGSDLNGYVSNFVETEQIFEIEDKLIRSFLQIRGSIPLVWSHKVGLSYAPEIVISEKPVFKNAHNILKSKYGEVFYLNLIKRTGYEGKIFKAFAIKQTLVNHLNIDFHNSGIAGNPEKEYEFVSSFDNVIKKFGERVSDKFQGGVIRTNCIDCLDRTNLVQFYIAKYVLGVQTSNSNLDFELKNLWFENGNKLSFQYAGTPAIKADIIKYGRKTIIGLYKDFYFSVKRYFLNRFKHGELQDCYDILTGKFKERRRKKKSNLPWIRNILIFGVFLLAQKFSFSTKIGFTIMIIFFIYTYLQGNINYPSS